MTSDRRTNLALLALVVLAVATGAVAFGIGRPWVRWVLLAHAVAGIGIVLLSPWKSAIVARGLRRGREGSWVSIALAALAVVVVVTGLSHSTGIAVSLGPISAMQLHVGAAIALVPLAAWHVVARRTWPRRTDLSRRNVLRSGLVLGGAAVATAGIEGAAALLGLPGAERRATGSFERGSFSPASMPVTQWLNDAVPSVDATRWVLTVRDADGERRIGYDELRSHRHRVRAVLDCTGGWWATQDWEGAWLADLLTGVDAAASIEVWSVTGYGRRLPAADAGRLLLATTIAGRPLSDGHGFPARLVAPGRRGFWWVKWVERIALSDVPAWWQAPFPIA
jgi:hypothetical protein